MVEPGLTLLAGVLTDGVVKVWVAGGTDGATYKITSIVTTDGARIKTAEIKVKVKEY